MTEKGSNQFIHNGLGIRNMKHRTKLLGGNIAWNTPEEWFFNYYTITG